MIIKKVKDFNICWVASKERISINEKHHPQEYLQVGGHSRKIRVSLTIGTQAPHVISTGGLLDRKLNEHPSFSDHWQG